MRPAVRRLFYLGNSLNLRILHKIVNKRAQEKLKRSLIQLYGDRKTEFCPHLPVVIIVHGARVRRSLLELMELGVEIQRRSEGKCRLCGISGRGHRKRLVYVPFDKCWGIKIEGILKVEIGGEDSLQTMTDQLRAFLVNEKQGVVRNGRKFILIGYSLGGLISRCALMDCPGRYSKIGHNCVKFVSLGSPQTGFRQGSKVPATWGAEHFTAYRKDITRHMREKIYLNRRRGSKFLRTYNNEEKVPGHGLRKNGERELDHHQQLRKQNIARIPSIFLFGGEMDIIPKISKVIDPWQSQFFGYVTGFWLGRWIISKVYDLRSSRIYEEDLVGLKKKRIVNEGGAPPSQSSSSSSSSSAELAGMRYLHVYRVRDADHAFWKERDGGLYMMERVFPELMTE